MIVDVTDPTAPTEISKVVVEVDEPEGIYINSHFAYVGGCRSTKLVTLDLSVEPPRVVYQISKPYYVQMVSTPRHILNKMYTSLWGSPGGLAVFDLDEVDGVATESFHLVLPVLNLSNRAVVSILPRTRAQLVVGLRF